MATLHLLGTGAALSDPHRTTTMLAVQAKDSVIVIDCGGDAVQKLMAAGVDLAKITALIVTHEHPDHVSGFALFMEKIWLAGRREPLPVYGIKPAIEQARRSFATFDTSDWEGLPEIVWLEVALQEGAKIVSDAVWHITAAPGTHSVPVIGLRIEEKGGSTLCYSCDTEKSSVITRLAKGAKLLVHEATGNFPGHASALQAAEVAKEAGAAELLLVHLPPEEDLGDEMAKARAIFSKTEKGEEGGSYAF